MTVSFLKANQKGPVGGSIDGKIHQSARSPLHGTWAANFAEGSSRKKVGEGGCHGDPKRQLKFMSFFLLFSLVSFQSFFLFELPRRVNSTGIIRKQVGSLWAIKKDTTKVISCWKDINTII